MFLKGFMMNNKLTSQIISMKMQRAGWILAFFALLSCGVIYVSVPLAAVAITLSFLSRGEVKTLTKANIWVLCMSITAIILSTALTVFMFAYVIGQYGSLDAFITEFENLYYNRPGVEI